MDIKTYSHLIGYLLVPEFVNDSYTTIPEFFFICLHKEWFQWIAKCFSLD